MIAVMHFCVSELLHFDIFGALLKAELNGNEERKKFVTL
jgi:hypothetical protein